MKTQQKKGLLALLGLGAGVFAWWKYRSMTPEKKEQLHAKVKDVGRKINDTVNEWDTKASQQFGEIKDSVTREVDNLKK